MCLVTYSYLCTQIQNNMADYLLNEHNKEEFPPAHTAEHLLNQTMIRIFGCERSRMCELIDEDLPVAFEFVTYDELEERLQDGGLEADSGISLDRLPDDVSDTIRLVRIGDYDVCPCIGKHVRSTSQIGRFEMLGTNWDEHERSFRVRFKIV